MERQNRLLTVLMIVLLLMLIPVLVKKSQDKGKDDVPSDPDAPATHELFDFEAKDVNTLTLKSASGTVRFSKDGDTWKMVEPKELAVEGRKVEEIVERFDTVKVEERELAGKLDDYGLDESHRAEVILGTSDNKTFSVFVGRDTPVGYKSYVKADEQAAPVLANTRISELAHRGMDDFRSKDIWSVSSYDARRIRIESNGQSIVLRKDGSAWWIGDDGPRADKDKVSKWLSDATALKASAFLDGQDPATLGLLNPSATITVEDEKGSSTLRFGTRDADGAVVQTASGGLVRVGAGGVGLLQMDSWTSDSLFNDSRYLVEGLELQFGDRSGKFIRQEGAWANAQGKPVSVDGFLDALEATKADRSQSGLPALTDSWGRITLNLGQGAQSVFLIGQLQGDVRLVREQAGGPVFTVKQADLDALASTMPG